MKTQISVLLFLLGLYLPLTQQRPVLSLLNKKNNFNVDIFNDALTYTSHSSDVIMLRIAKIVQKASDDSIAYELRVAVLDQRAFKFFNFNRDKYFGFFNYRKHFVLVYGDNSADYFFSKVNFKKRFEFMPEKPYDFDKNPPISVEPSVFLYNYKNGRLKLKDTGMLGFFN